MEAAGRFTTPAPHGILCVAMNELRELRRAIGLGQREFAALLSISLETYRPWDSGRRVASATVLQRARKAVIHHQRRHELLPLDQLAKELHVHLGRSKGRAYRQTRGALQCAVGVRTSNSSCL